MDSPSAEGESSTTALVVARSSMMDSIRSLGLSGLAGVKIDKEELTRRLLMPQNLRVAMLDSIKKQDIEGGNHHFHLSGSDDVPCPESPMVVFINPRSGGRIGPVLKERLQQLISEEQVFDLQEVKPHDFVRYGLACLEKWANNGDFCAKEIRKNIRVLVAGGDGTVGWVLGCLGELNQKGREPVPPVAIVPLGTGNDLSRSFGWGGSFPFAWKSGIKKTLHRAAVGPISYLDSWHFVMEMPGGEVDDPPHSLHATEVCCLDKTLEIEEDVPDNVNGYEGVFYNYFSIGMDAQVAYGFHHLRNEKPYLAHGPFTNKYCSQGISLTEASLGVSRESACSVNQQVYFLSVHLIVSWEEVFPEFHAESVSLSLNGICVRAIIALNLHNYGSGRNPWGDLKPEYLEKKGFVEARADDGILEILGLKQGWHASFVMVKLISAKHIAQASLVRLEIRGGEWKDVFMQMDGEPWKLPISKDYSTLVEIQKVPFQSLMVNGE
ncbi:hypothetical protein V6N12_008282 [Hibiscus sabdariffa]|uniref:Diacylglycerol kinase n=1 Tax=Hibiscus sabdariffa TaxID=183260 RepID=A0ABR2B3A5_9ROSI